MFKPDDVGDLMRDVASAKTWMWAAEYTLWMQSDGYKSKAVV